MKLEYKYIYITAIPVILGILFLSAFSANSAEKESGKQGNEKIIKFSHSFHKDLATCTDCHGNVLTSKSAKDRLLPNHDNCKACHDVEDGEACKTCHYEDINEPLIQHSSGIVFDHSFHAGQRGMKCEECHKGINDVDYAFQAVEPYPQMPTCYSCHNDRSVATNACEACHTNTSNLKPINHQSSQFITTHKFAAKSSNANCVMCHDANNNSCTDCHVSTTAITDKNTPLDFYAPYSPSNFVDGPKMQKINRVHDLNFRFNHSIEAKGKTKNCESCHEKETFCANCHQSKNGDFSMGGITPVSHLQSNFVNFGAGSSLNDHGKLAKRDIETCASCHDTQGADPVCMTCHLDPDGIRGNNPKTHPSGFMKDDHGDWHETTSSICYNCHTSASPNSPSGVGFCGYCHGVKR